MIIGRYRHHFYKFARYTSKSITSVCAVTQD